MTLRYDHTFLAYLAILLGIGGKGDVFFLHGGIGYHRFLHSLRSMHSYGLFHDQLTTLRTNAFAEVSQAGGVNWQFPVKVLCSVKYWK